LMVAFWSIMTFWREYAWVTQTKTKQCKINEAEHFVNQMKTM
jgi:hypothetical protein